MDLAKQDNKWSTAEIEDIMSGIRNRERRYSTTWAR